ncbi:hypothetical protein FPSE_09021 [Fusarium pseudograminearum CS3096]|uniref:Uncharacterized protein n=1 Tax=Fusarium pseudograminearum (strain CS3096) TaxID=1028729 RepID=K3VYK0_FUSPC|nr:hypothetical protein FPSE_09021 [Fusarium pseudograminearum CS3096]EKJ70785.1 hypothetical protein FPSE_09021 [Fusarium pseudograminearum CS3096]
MERASLLLSLSPELIFQIVGHCPATILTLALTCSSVYRLCQPVLKQHRDAYKKYKVTSDLSPETVLHLLRAGPTAEIERWHTDWRRWSPELPGAYGLAEEDPSRSALSAQELQRCTRKGTEWWELSRSDINNIQNTLESGNDGYLKTLLIASCPRVHSIRFAKRPKDSWSVLNWIRSAIGWSKCGNGKWPPGFESLRNMAVGVSIGLSPHEEDNGSLHGSILTLLLHLPHLKNLYFCDPFEIRHPEDGNEDEYFDLRELCDFPANTSSVEYLFLDNPTNLSAEFFDALASAPKDLDTLVVKARGPSLHNFNAVDTLVVDFARENPQLKRLVVYNGESLCGEYGWLTYLPSDLKGFNAIKHHSISATGITDQACDPAYGYIPDMVKDEWFHEAFPPCIEAIYVWGESELRGDEIEPLEVLDFLLARIIESGAYKDLKVIYVDNVESSARWWGLKGLSFQKTIAAGQKTGVHICTFMNRDDGGYWKNFPARPDRFDLKTGPCGGKRPANWRLNLYTGEWGPNCMGCGECDKCWAVYPPELWKKHKTVET